MCVCVYACEFVMYVCVHTVCVCAQSVYVCAQSVCVCAHSHPRLNGGDFKVYDTLEGAVSRRVASAAR